MITMVQDLKELSCDCNTCFSFGMLFHWRITSDIIEAVSDQVRNKNKVRMQAIISALSFRPYFSPNLFLYSLHYRRIS